MQAIGFCGSVLAVLASVVFAFLGLALAPSDAVGGELFFCTSLAFGFIGFCLLMISTLEGAQS